MHSLYKSVDKGNIQISPKQDHKLQNNGLPSNWQSHKLENNGLASNWQSHKLENNGLASDSQSHYNRGQNPYK
jgi:hypothetical protein